MTEFIDVVVNFATLPVVKVTACPKSDLAHATTSRLDQGADTPVLIVDQSFIQKLVRR